MDVDSARCARHLQRHLQAGQVVAGLDAIRRSTTSHYDLCRDDTDTQARFLETKINGVRMANIYPLHGNPVVEFLPSYTRTPHKAATIAADKTLAKPMLAHKNRFATDFGVP